MCISGGDVGEGVNEGRRSGKFRMWWWSVEFWDHLGGRKTANLVGLN